MADTELTTRARAVLAELGDDARWLNAPDYPGIPSDVAERFVAAGIAGRSRLGDESGFFMNDLGRAVRRLAMVRDAERARDLLPSLRNASDGELNTTGAIVISVAATDGPAPVKRSMAKQARQLRLIESHPDRPRIRVGTRWYDGVRLTDLGREVARLLANGGV